MIELNGADWREAAACIGVDDKIFFPEAVRNSGAHAKAICAGCPVRTTCLNHALDTGEEYGIWGGMGEDERRKLRRRMTRPKRTRVCIDCPSNITGPARRCDRCKTKWDEGVRDRANEASRRRRREDAA